MMTQARIERLAEAMEIASTTGAPESKPWTEQDWRIWTLCEHGHGAQTHVVQGPTNIVVMGDLADFIFERHGGLALGFVWVGDLSYAAQKCRAGKVYEYDADKARKDIADALASHVEDGHEVSPDLKAEMDELDYDNEQAVHQWWHDEVCCDDWSSFGKRYSDEFLRACACILRVYRHETSKAEVGR